MTKNQTTKILSFNANGIRAAARKGFYDWLKKTSPDVVCVQETKAQFHQLADDAQFSPEGYVCRYHDAEKKGYSGVALYSKVAPKNIVEGIGWEYLDNEGRFIAFEYEDVTVISLYVHSGTSGEERQTLKYRFMDDFFSWLQEKREEKLIICGDWNIAHTEKDIKNAKGNKKNSGFLPEEREWLTKLFAAGYTDAFREVDDRDEQYTWWSNRGQAWANNTGWRIDYHIISDVLAEKVLNASIYKDERFSDHAPLTLEYDFILR